MYPSVGRFRNAIAGYWLQGLFDAGIAFAYKRRCKRRVRVRSLDGNGDVFSWRRGGRVAEGGGLLNRCTGSTRTVSSNLIPSANYFSK